MAIIHDVAHDANWGATEQVKEFWEDFKLVVMSSPMIHLDENSSEWWQIYTGKISISCINAS